jgi:hypothetical protein
MSTMMRTSTSYLMYGEDRRTPTVFSYGEEGHELAALRNETPLIEKFFTTWQGVTATIIMAGLFLAALVATAHEDRPATPFQPSSQVINLQPAGQQHPAAEAPARQHVAVPESAPFMQETPAGDMPRLIPLDFGTPDATGSFSIEKLQPIG